MVEVQVGPGDEFHVQVDLGDGGAVESGSEQAVIEDDEDHLVVEAAGFQYLVDKDSGLVFTMVEDADEDPEEAVRQPLLP